MLNDNKLAVYFISSFSFVKTKTKTSGCQIKEKNIMFESISKAGACRRLFKPCHQEPLKAK